MECCLLSDFTREKINSTSKMLYRMVDEFAKESKSGYLKVKFEDLTIEQRAWFDIWARKIINHILEIEQ